jgi:predicted amidophosphoribosyltransferase
MILLLILIILYIIFKSQLRVKCNKWLGDIKKSPKNICKDCGYPIDCHGPYKGDSWRHVFKTE